MIVRGRTRTGRSEQRDDGQATAIRCGRHEESADCGVRPSGALDILRCCSTSQQMTHRQVDVESAGTSWPAIGAARIRDVVNARSPDRIHRDLEEVECLALALGRQQPARDERRATVLSWPGVNARRPSRDSATAERYAAAVRRRATCGCAISAEGDRAVPEQCVRRGVRSIETPRIDDATNLAGLRHSGICFSCPPTSLPLGVRNVARESSAAMLLDRLAAISWRSAPAGCTRPASDRSTPRRGPGCRSSGSAATHHAHRRIARPC